MKNRICGEFHIHTTLSDGCLNYIEILEYMKGKIDYLAITDHDAIEDSIKCSNISSLYGIKAIIGVEISTDHNDESIHILGYFKNANNQSFYKLLSTLEEIRNARVTRLYKIKNSLKENFNIDLDATELLKKSSITRGSIAREIIRQGYDYKIEELFESVIGKGCKAYYPTTKMPTKKAIDLIHECGGLAVLAHPTLIKNSSVEDFISMNIDGIEAIYPLNKEGEEKIYKEIALNNNLFFTAGTDFHCFNDKSHGDLLTLGLFDEDLEKFIRKIDELL